MANPTAEHISVQQCEALLACRCWMSCVTHHHPLSAYKSAYVLGFSERPNLRRAFIKWTGKLPSV